MHHCFKMSVALDKYVKYLGKIGAPGFRQINRSKFVDHDINRGAVIDRYIDEIDAVAAATGYRRRVQRAVFDAIDAVRDRRPDFGIGHRGRAFVNRCRSRADIKRMPDPGIR